MHWKVVCRSKKEGGLGVKDLEIMNTVLLSKWWWRLFADMNHLWGALINRIYYHRRKPLLVGLSFRSHSFWWCSVLATKDVFKCGVSFSIGDGQKVNFWTDIWSGQASLRIVYLHIFDRVTCKNQVKEC